MGHDMAPALDYSQEARNLWERLGINPEEVNQDKKGFNRVYNPLDIIYKSKSGGCIYVGGERAARDLEILKEKDIKAYHTGLLSYYNFNIAWWRKYVGKSEKDLVSFLSPVLKYIDTEIEAGRNVFVHCLAGAHRAGTTAIICLMHFAGLESSKGILTAKALRAIIQPIGDFQKLLKFCDELPRHSDGRFILE